MRKKKQKKFMSPVLLIVIVVLVSILMCWVWTNLWINQEAHYKITLGGKEVSQTEMYNSLFNENASNVNNLNINWLNQHCVVLDSNCTYVKKKQGINVSKEYVSNTEQTPDCLNINDCFDEVCKGPIWYQCQSYIIEVIK